MSASTKDWWTILTADGTALGKVDINCGIFLAPVPPLVNHLIFIDDLKLYICETVRATDLIGSGVLRAMR